MTPYLQLLLNRKRNDPTVPYDDPNDPMLRQPMDERLPSGPTIALSRLQQPRASPAIAPAIPLARQAAIATGDTNESYLPRLPVTDEPAPEIPATVKLGARIAQDRQALADAQSHHHSKARDILEGLGQYVGSGIGLNVHRLIYPHGNAEEQAQRQLATDVGLQKVATDDANTQSTIALRGAQARKIQADLENPDTSDEDKRKLVLAQEILKSHPQPFDPNDPADVVAMKKLSDAGIPIPKSYGKLPKAAGPPETRTRMEGGVKYQTEFDPKSGKFVYSTDDQGNRIVIDEAKPEPETASDVPDTTAPWLKEESDQREIAKNANKSAAEARKSVLDYVAQDPNVDQKNDPRILSALASAKRLEETEKNANKRADDAHAKRIEAQNKDAENRAKVKKPRVSASQPSPSTHVLNKKAWLQSHPETDWPKAVAAAKSSGYQIQE